MNVDVEGATGTAPGGEVEIDRLAERAAGGDRVAVDRFLHAVRPTVVRYCRARMRGPAGILTPDDVAQDVLIAVCTALPRLRDDGSPVLAFLFGIARNKIADAYRAAGRDRSRPSDDLPESASDDPGPELDAVLTSEKERLRWALDQLPEHQREVLVLRIALSYSADEVARHISSTPGAVRVTQHRAMRRLRQLLEEE